MPEVFVAKVSELPDGERRIVEHAGEEIGVFHWQGAYYAYQNLCVHQGGPACEGIIMHKVEDVLGPDRTWHGQKFSDEVHFVCPWHGYEYDLKTGECAADRRLRLKTYSVVRRGRTSMSSPDALSDGEIQALLARAVRLYAERVAASDEPLAAFPADAQITATDAVVTTTAILKAVNVQVFELGMWQAWSGR